MDIDDRAAQLAGFALLMKAREDDRRIFSRGVRLNVMALQSTQHLDARALWRDLNLTGDWHQGQSQSLFESEQKPLSSNDNTYKAIVDLIERFQEAKTFGSLIEVPNSVEAPLKTLLKVLTELADSGDTMQMSAARQLKPIVHQAWMLAQRYEAVVANPPYIGRKYFNVSLKRYIDKCFPISKGDAYSAFIERNIALASIGSSIGMITIPNWMFNSGFEDLRKLLIGSTSINSLIHNGRGVWGSDFGSCSFVLNSYCLEKYRGKYKRLFKKQGSVASSEELRERFFSYPEHLAEQKNFKSIPGCLFAYWISSQLRSAFEKGKQIEDLAPVRQGFQTGNNDRFVRMWQEVSINKIKMDANMHSDVVESKAKWVPYNKGGDFRKWYGNNAVVVAFDEENYEALKKSGNCLPSRNLYFRESITWSAISSGVFGARYSPTGAVFSADGACAFPHENSVQLILGLLNSKVSTKIMEFFAATIHFNVGNIRKIPVAHIGESERRELFESVDRLVSIGADDWDCFEYSPGFKRNFLIVNSGHDDLSIRVAYENMLQKTKIRLWRQSD